MVEIELVFTRALIGKYEEAERHAILKACENINLNLRTSAATVPTSVCLTTDLVTLICTKYLDIRTRIFVVPLVCKALTKFGLWHALQNDYNFLKVALDAFLHSRPFILDAIRTKNIRHEFILKMATRELRPAYTRCALFAIHFEEDLWHLFYRAFGCYPSPESAYWDVEKRVKIFSFFLEFVTAENSANAFIVSLAARAPVHLDDINAEIFTKSLSSDEFLGRLYELDLF
jgi:hypothetical protein